MMKNDLIFFFFKIEYDLHVLNHFDVLCKNNFLKNKKILLIYILI